LEIFRIAYTHIYLIFLAKKGDGLMSKSKEYKNPSQETNSTSSTDTQSSTTQVAMKRGRGESLRDPKIG